MSKLREGFDLIILQHSLEHMQDPLLALKEAFRLLKHKRYVFIRVPVVPNFSWWKYGVDWIALDPPRHLFVPTLKGMDILCGKAGFGMKGVVFDSNEYQFYGSEQYLRDIPLTDNRSYLVNPGNSIFSEEEIGRFKIKAKELNEKRDGDQASFYLYKR